MGIITSRWHEAPWSKLVFLLGCIVLLQTRELAAEQVSVRHTEGLQHGFLALRTREGSSRALTSFLYLIPAVLAWQSISLWVFRLFFHNR